ncbi:PIN domain-containing protein [Streptomyces sp. NPDC001922]|uniref:PIN domain-containing protein n=1 Tax=Streptomyces sp. NPDC001922 TaxID=3364624 RepID=UPI0036BD91D4
MDSSALLTLLTGRHHSSALRSALAARPGVPMATSSVGFVETVRHLDMVGSFPNALTDLDGMVTEILLTEEVRNLAARVPGSLRSLDAIHVASALTVGEALDSLISYDKRMLDAAREAGLVVLAPGMTD